LQLIEFFHELSPVIYSADRALAELRMNVKCIKAFELEGAVILSLAKAWKEISK
jgi:hypothetical protein